MKELNVSDDRKEKGLQAVKDLLTYDPKFERVFTYLFNNTYLVNDVEEAKKLGVGRCRYVTDHRRDSREVRNTLGRVEVQDDASRVARQEARRT